MCNESEKVVYSGINQPIKVDFVNLNLAAVESIKNSKLYKNAAKVHPSAENHEKLMLASTVTTNNWDTVSICRVTALNARIKNQKTYPADISYTESSLSLSGNFDAWQIVPGGDGRNVKLKLPMKSGTYVGMDFGKGTSFDLANVSVDIYVKLNYLPVPEPTAKDGTYDLHVNTTKVSESEPIASVISLDDPSETIDNLNKSILRGLFEKWLNLSENLEKFNTLFATVLINNMGEKSEDFKWLRATSISYAYTDKNTEDSSIFGILCMTNNRSAAGLPNQLPAVDLQQDDNAVFLISREIFVKYQLIPSLPYVFSDSPDAQYIVDEAGTTVTTHNLKMDNVKVGAIDYHPVAENFEICFDETFIRTSAKIRTNISPGIDATTTITTKQTLGLGKNDKGEQVMTYEMIGDPDVQNSTDIAAWVVVTEAVIALIGAVVVAIVAVVASLLVATIVAIVVAIVIAVVGIIIHVIIQEAIAGSVTGKLPNIAPMVKVATNQIKWPFCAEDAFVLKDIDYSGAISFNGNLKLLDSYKIVNKRLVPIAFGAEHDVVDRLESIEAEIREIGNRLRRIDQRLSKVIM
ncbi:MAG: TULIP family P47-like protein [Methanosarcina sp.]|uniref:TULIP family P47-like protein n=1 Tax=Methanosarcina sp. TaxID=2213 RepID=UPI00260F2EB4|nr:TULIP family P47-like protein [Methanosarcina sp.]MDD3247228.1 TULIP family P47-like protein [Methanosarcina sp.]MDD4248533.1 TULIP family P47-like protein [Methanosarcina sp.]